MSADKLEFMLSVVALAFVVAWWAAQLIVSLPTKMLREYGEVPPSWMRLDLSASTRAAFSTCIALLWLGIFLSRGLGPAGFMLAAGGSLLVLLAFIDWRTRLLPDRLIYLLLWAGLLSGTQDWLPVTLNQSVYGACIGYVSFALFAYVARFFGGDDAIGQGDVKLLAAIGAWIGPLMLLPVILAASVSAFAVGLYIKKSQPGEPNESIPFGPFLSGGGLLVWSFATELTSYFLA